MIKEEATSNGFAYTSYELFNENLVPRTPFLRDQRVF